MHSVAFDNVSVKSVGYLIGLYLGDGYLYHHKKSRHYTVEFFLNSEKDKDIMDKLIQLLQRINLNPLIFKDPRSHVNRIRVFSKQLFCFLQNFSIKDPKIMDNDLLLGILSGFIDAEGYVSPGNIQICQKDTTIMETIVEICLILGVRINTRKKLNPPNGYIWRATISTALKHLPHDSVKIKRHYPQKAFKGTTGSLM